MVSWSRWSRSLSARPVGSGVVWVSVGGDVGGDGVVDDVPVEVVGS
jgi:hypothetical protein